LFTLFIFNRVSNKGINMNQNENPAHVQCPYCKEGYNDEQTGAKILFEHGEEYCCNDCVGDAIQVVLDKQVDFSVEHITANKIAKELIELNKQKDEK
jgi:Zn finger protein HypA/HybF involved in hydrogenase expression